MVWTPVALQPFVYECGPVDYWDGMIPLADYFRQCAQNPTDADGLTTSNYCDSIDDALQWVLAYARVIAVYSGIERDRHLPFVAALPPRWPSTATVKFLIVKIDNNGTTYVASPVRLPWLEPRLPQPQDAELDAFVHARYGT